MKFVCLKLYEPWVEIFAKKKKQKKAKRKQDARDL